MDSEISERMMKGRQQAETLRDIVKDKNDNFAGVREPVWEN